MSTPATNTVPTTIHLFSLSTPLPIFLASVASLRPQPLTVAKVAKWIHAPEFRSVNSLVADKSWDVLLLLRGSSDIPESLKASVRASWSITAKVPREILESYRDKNRTMLHPKPEDMPKLHPQAVGDNTVPRQDQSEPLALQVSPELKTWFRSFSTTDGAGPVSMFNLLSDADKGKYLGYIQAFAETLVPRYGGTPKIIGEVADLTGEEKVWDDIAIVQYPSITHFADMLASEEYAAIDRKHKVGALKDTGVLCILELDL